MKTEITFTTRDMDTFMDGMMKIFIIIENASPDNEKALKPTKFVYDFKTSEFQIVREEKPPRSGLGTVAG